MTRPIDDLFGELSRPLGPTDWPDPAHLRRTAEHKRTVRRVSVASSMAVVAAVAFAVPATLAHRQAASVNPASSAPAVLNQKVAPLPTPAAVVSSHAESPAPGVHLKSPLTAGAKKPFGKRITYGSLSIVVPYGWTEASAPVFGFAAPTTKVCIAPAVTPDQSTFDSCAGLEIWYGGFLPGAYGTSFEGNRETSPAWYHGTGQATCPGTQTTAGPIATSVGGPDVWDYYRLGNKTAVHNGWTVSCSDGTTFMPQAWYLPVSHILFWSYLSDPTAQAILATVQ
jgi:hypothetical protein